VERPGNVEIVDAVESLEPALVDGFEPVDELLPIPARRFDPIAEPSRPVGLPPVPRFRIERERVSFESRKSQWSLPERIQRLP